MSHWINKDECFYEEIKDEDITPKYVLALRKIRNVKESIRRFFFKAAISCLEKPEEFKESERQLYSFVKH